MSKERLVLKSEVLATKDLRLNQVYDFDISHKDYPWMEELLREYSTLADLLDPGEFKFQGAITKKYLQKWSEYFIIEGKLLLKYFTECVNTLEPMVENLEVELNGLVIEKGFGDNDHFLDEIEMAIDGKVRDLYFYEKEGANLRDIFQEYIELNKNPYPKVKSFEGRKP